VDGACSRVRTPALTCKNTYARGVCDRKLSLDFATVRSVDEQLLLHSLDAPPDVDSSGGAPTVKVVRSARRKRTISAHRDGDTIIVSVPARISAAEEAMWVERMTRRVLAAERRRHRSDDELLVRARELSATYLEGRASPSGVRWVDNQTHRWGSCTPADGTIRLSRRLATMPSYVVDYVLLHELVHLLEPSHGPAFQAWMSLYPKLERAEGYLEAAAAGMPAA
jgi:predicted metal-dependent hydrolase